MRPPDQPSAARERSRAAVARTVLREEQRRLLFADTGIPILLSLGVALVLALVVVETHPPRLVLFWLAVMTAIGCWRLWLLLSYRRQKTRLSASTLFPRFMAGIILARMGWGFACIALIPVDQPRKLAIFCAVICGVTSAAMPALSASRGALTTFLALILPPFAGRLLVTGNSDHALLGGLVLAFFAVCMIGADRLHTNIADNIALRFAAVEREKRLGQREDQLHNLLQHVPLGIVHCSSDGGISEVNEAFAQLLEQPPETIVGNRFEEMVATPLLLSAYGRAREGRRGEAEGEFSHPHSGRKTPIHALFTSTGKSSGHRSGVIGIVEDRSERKEFEMRIAHQARSDALTGLANRRSLAEKLDQELARASRHNQCGALLLLDIDNFKTINDSLGHQAGDTLLKTVAERMLCSLRQEDVVARMGGDEFAVLLPQLATTPEHAAERAQQVTAKLKAALAPPPSPRRRGGERHPQHRHNPAAGSGQKRRRPAQAGGHRDAPGQERRPQYLPLFPARHAGCGQRPAAAHQRHQESH